MCCIDQTTLEAETWLWLFWVNYLNTNPLLEVNTQIFCFHTKKWVIFSMKTGCGYLRCVQLSLFYSLQVQYRAISFQYNIMGGNKPQFRGDFIGNHRASYPCAVVICDPFHKQHKLNQNLQSRYIYRKCFNYRKTCTA